VLLLLTTRAEVLDAAGLEPEARHREEMAELSEALGIASALAVRD
jgi:hypothetical protein